MKSIILFVWYFNSIYALLDSLGKFLALQKDSYSKKSK